MGTILVEGLCGASDARGLGFKSLAVQARAVQ